MATKTKPVASPEAEQELVDQARHEAQERVADVHVEEGTVKSEGAQNSPGVDQEGSEDDADRLERIRRAAYFAAERRGFAPGFEEVDWLEAEREVDAAP